jgi:TIR domain/NACHT domain/PBS lyase HEAT-like repeat
MASPQTGLRSPSDVFLSYARVDGSEGAERIEAALGEKGWSVWRDRRSINPYQDFSAEIELAIRDSRFVVVCVSPSIDSNPDSFVRREIIYAQHLGKPIVPAVMPNAVVPILVNHLTWIACGTGPFGEQRPDFEGGLERLFERLVAGVPPTGRPPGRDDPLRRYLGQLYEQIVEWLDSTVLSLVPLGSVESPGAVEGGGERRHALPVTFLDRAPRRTAAAARPSAPARYENLLDAFRQHRGRLLVLGAPGAGKTTALLAFARDAVARRLEDPAQPVPIVAHIATWDPSTRRPLRDWLSSLVTALDKETMDRILAGGQALLLLDGLDELGHERRDEQGKIYDPRLRFVEELPADQDVVISCRAREYEELGQQLSLNGAVLLQPLNDEQIGQFLQDQPDLLAAVRNDDELLTMARTPLLLSLFAFAFADLADDSHRLRHLGEGPSELRNEVMRAYIERRIEHEQHRGQEADVDTGRLDAETVYDVFGTIAADLVVENRSRLTEWAFEKVVDGGRPSTWIDLGEQLHLIVSDESNHWRFMHLLLRDHFAFDPLRHELNDRGSLRREDIARALGGLQDARAIEPLVTRLNDESEVEAVRCAATAALSAFEDRPDVVLALRQVPAAPDSALRAHVVLALGRLGDEQIVEELIACARFEFEPTPYRSGRLRETYDDRRYIAYQAAEVLRRGDGPEAAAAVRAYVDREAWANNREWAQWQEHADYEGFYE